MRCDPGKLRNETSVPHSGATSRYPESSSSLRGGAAAPNAGFWGEDWLFVAGAHDVLFRR